MSTDDERNVGEPQAEPPAREVPELDELWSAWARGRDVAVRNTLANAYLPLVKHVARLMAASLSSRAEFDDLVGFGTEGLLAAIDRFDPGRGVQFATFAAYRIRGAIYDGIRSSDWVPRSIRRREREIRDNHAWLCAQYGREPTEGEEADLLGVSVAVFRSLRAQLASSQVGAYQGGDVAEGDAGLAEPSAPTPGPLESFLSGEELTELKSALAQLSEREHAVITMSYSEGKTLAEIGRMLGVTESRVCQMRGSALRNLRASLEQRGMAAV